MPRILVADDNSNIQKMVALAFEEHGIDVVAVGNGEAAVRRLPDLNPDVVLADVFMPVRNGYEVCEFVKKDPRFSKIPVILLVGAFDPLDEQEARRVGADGVLKKPFVPPDPLIAMVTAALEKAPKPEVKAAAEPVAEIPKVAPPPSAVPEAFPEPTPEEEAYMFGTGRRSLDDDEKTEAAAPLGGAASAPAAVQTAVETDTDAEDEAKFSGTRADWRRREEVDFAAVPSYSADLVDAAAEARAEANVAHDVAPLVEQRAEAPVIEAGLFAVQPEAEARVEGGVATGAIETFSEAPVVESVEPAAPTVHEPPAATEVASVSQAAVVETVPATLADSAQVETPSEFAAAPPARVEEPPAAESAPILSAVVETVTSPRKWLDFLLPSRASRSSDASAEPAAVTQAVPPIEPVVTQVPAENPSLAAASPFSDATIAESAASATRGSESVATDASSATYESAPVETPSDPVPQVLNAGTEQPMQEAGQHWSEIASQLAAEAPLVEAAQSAMNAERSAAPEAEAPAFLARESSVAETPTPESFTPPAEVSASVESAAPEASSPAVPSLAEVIERASATAAAPAIGPNVDEVVAKILEKLGPQIQELLAKGVVKPLVEDMLKNSDEKKK